MACADLGLGGDEGARQRTDLSARHKPSEAEGRTACLFSLASSGCSLLLICPSKDKNTSWIEVLRAGGSSPLQTQGLEGARCAVPLLAGSCCREEKTIIPSQAGRLSSVRGEPQGSGQPPGWAVALLSSKDRRVFSHSACQGFHLILFKSNF